MGYATQRTPTRSNDQFEYQQTAIYVLSGGAIWAQTLLFASSDANYTVRSTEYGVEHA